MYNTPELNTLMCFSPKLIYSVSKCIFFLAEKEAWIRRIIGIDEKAVATRQ